MRRAAAIALASALVIVAGCAMIAGLGDYVGDDGGDDRGDDAAGDDASADGGWIAVALFDGQKDPVCDPGFTVVFDGGTAATGDCACSCGDPIGGRCPASP